MKRIEHKTKEDSKEPIMEETYITLNCRWLAFLKEVLNILQPTNNYEIFNIVILCVRKVRIYGKWTKKENEIADFGSMKLIRRFERRQELLRR